MQTFVAFVLGVGNLGSHREPRKRMAIWIRDMNLSLANFSSTRVLDAYGHTGNFIVSARGEREFVAGELRKVLKTGCAVLTLSDLSSVLGALVDDCKPESDCYRRTPGAVLLVDGNPSERNLCDASIATYDRFDASVITVQKKDALTPKGTLDQARRGGGWGAIASDVGKQIGGKWTARSKRTLLGVLKLGQRYGRGEKAG